ncbi:caspase-8-like isoform X2 [Mustelus asterias]
MDDAHFQLHSQLHHISENLGSEELRAMKFFCRDLLPSNRLDKADSGLKLFSALQEKGLLDVTDTFIVAELLYRTKQFKLLKGLKYDRWEVCQLLKDPDKARGSSYRQLLFEVSEEITTRDLETVKHFLHNHLSKFKLESMTTMLDVFVEMEKEGLLEETNMELLKRICKELGEPLAKKFDHYMPSIAAQCATGGTGRRPDVESVIHLTPTAQTIPTSGKLVPRGSRPAELSGALKSHNSLSVEFSRNCGLKEPLHSPSIELSSGQQSLGSYRMESNPRGSCVIINNGKFKTMGERRGTHVDAERLDAVFRWLGFEVTLYKNLTAEEMRNTMLVFQQMDHTARDCFVCCILTHGERGVMCGTDSEQVAISEITSFFSGTRCPSLREKPKLFFIQACQGRKKQDCVEIEIQPSITGIQSPSAGIQSPSAGIQSPSAGIQSPSAGFQSPSAGIQSPSAGIQSPSAGIQSPSAGIQSPSAGIQSPSAGIQSPSAGIQSPSAWIQSPSARIQSSSAGIQSSSAGIQSSSAGIQSSSAGMQSSSAGMQSSSAGMQSSSAGVQSSSAGIQSSSAGIQSSSAGMQSSSTGIQSPSAGIQPSSAGIQSPSALIQSPSAGIQSSSAGIQSSSAGIQPSSAGIQSSSAGIQSSSAGIQLPSFGIESPLEEDAVCSSATIPDEADFLLGMATVEGYVSYRHIQEGAWYIQSLCENLEKYCGSEDLLSILTIVNRDVSGKKDKQDKTQMPQPRYTLRKKLYFPVTQTFSSFTNSL